MASLDELRENQQQLVTAADGSTPMPELQHNLNLLVDMAASDVSSRSSQVWWKSFWTRHFSWELIFSPSIHIFPVSLLFFLRFFCCTSYLLLFFFFVVYW